MALPQNVAELLAQRKELLGRHQKNRCSICGDARWADGEHNAEPINHGRCCGICNVTVVIPARMERIAAGRAK